MSLLIAIEGLDGAGKSTLAEKLVEAMKADPAFFPWIYLSKEPGSVWTGIGPEIRKMVLETPEFRAIERELLFYVDASLHARFIENQGNAIVVSDRGLWSHLAYLRGYLKTKQIDHDEYSLCKKLIARTSAKPDCVIYLKSDLGLMKERLAGKKADAIESQPVEFFQAVQETYNDLEAEAQWRGDSMLTLDARGAIDNNIMQVVDYLKGVFHEKQLREGNREVC
jgi:dTMP kinase